MGLWDYRNLLGIMGICDGFDISRTTIANFHCILVK